VLFFMVGLLFHAIETLDSRRHSVWPPQRAQRLRTDHSDPHAAVGAFPLDALSKLSFTLVSIRPLLEAQASDTSHD
jgi:hypothetical protein